jgi:hypothetical protein
VYFSIYSSRIGFDFLSFSYFSKTFWGKSSFFLSCFLFHINLLARFSLKLSTILFMPFSPFICFLCLHTFIYLIAVIIFIWIDPFLFSEIHSSYVHFLHFLRNPSKCFQIVIYVLLIPTSCNFCFRFFSSTFNGVKITYTMQWKSVHIYSLNKILYWCDYVLLFSSLFVTEFKLKPAKLTFKN